MRKESKEENFKASENQIIFIRFCYISILLIILSDILDLWTALSSLGVFFLFLICPFIMAIIAYQNYKKINLSKSHKRVFYLSFFIH